MIKLNKKPEPNILSNNKIKWTSELMYYVNLKQKVPDQIINRYNHPDIKTILKEETNNGKCMYCESTISVVAPEHIEHYRPKKHYPELTFEWSNLGLSCPRCNLNKKDVFDENCTYINPYNDSPDKHFISLGTMIYHKPNDKRALLTEFKLELNRPELMEARKTRIEAIRPLIDQYVAENNPTLRSILKREIEKEIAEDKPYSMCAKAVYKLILFP